MASELADRIREIIKVRGLASARELGRMAGMKTPTQLSNIIAKLEANPDAIELKTLRKIADAAGVQWEWLLVGVGPRDVDTIVEPDDRYYNRAAVIAMYRHEVHPKAIDALREKYVAFHGDDPSKKQWTDWLWAEDARVKREEMHPSQADKPKTKKKQK